MRLQLSFLTIILFLFSWAVQAQVGIGTENPDASAMLQIEASDKGVLITRVALSSTTDNSTVTSPASGLLVYNTATAGIGDTAVSPGFYFFNGSVWVRLLNTGNVISNTASITANTNAIANLTDSDTTYSAGTGLSLAGTEFSVDSSVVTSTYGGDLALSGKLTAGGGIETSGTVTATAFVGDGSGLTGISTGVTSSTFKDAYKNISIGTEMKSLNSSKVFYTDDDGNRSFSYFEGYANIAIGDSTLLLNTIGNSNTAIGLKALASNTEGDDNIAFGMEALRDNTTGGDNIAFGKEALRDNITGNDNISIGEEALRDNTEGDNNIAIGEDALKDNTAGHNNIAFGENALQENTTGNNNIAIGENALLANDEDSNNIAIGLNAFNELWLGGNNIAIGFEAGASNGDDGNAVYGAEGLTLIGAKSNIMDEDITNSTAIGYEAIVTQDNTIQLGNYSVTHVVTSGTLSATAFVGDGSGLTGVSDRTSDQRLKTEIKGIHGASAQLLQLQPKKYKKKRSLESNEYTLEEMGFMAQDIQKLLPFLVKEGKDPDKLLSLDYNSFIALLVKGFQEQQQAIEKMNTRLAKIEAALEQTN